MLKMIGCLCLFLGCTGFGLMQARKYRERPKQLHLVQVALQSLETEIEYAATPLPIAFNRVAKRTEEPIASILAEIGGEIADHPTDVHEIVEAVFRKHQHRVFLSKEDREMLKQFAAHLGISDRKDQVKHFKWAQQSLSHLEQRAAEDRVRLEKMWNYLGPLVGALMVVLLY